MGLPHRMKLTRLHVARLWVDAVHNPELIILYDALQTVSRHWDGFSAPYAPIEALADDLEDGKGPARCDCERGDTFMAGMTLYDLLTGELPIHFEPVMSGEMTLPWHRACHSARLQMVRSRAYPLHTQAHTLHLLRARGLNHLLYAVSIRL